MRICNVERGWMRNRLPRNPCMARCRLRVSRPASRIPHSISILRGFLNINIESRQSRKFTFTYDRTVFTPCATAASFVRKFRVLLGSSARNFFPLLPTTRDVSVARGSHEPLHSGARAKGIELLFVAACHTMHPTRFSLVIGNKPLSIGSPRKSLVCRSLSLSLGVFYRSHFPEFLGVCSWNRRSEFRRKDAFRSGERRLLLKVYLSEISFGEISSYCFDISKIYCKHLRTLQCYIL